MSLDASKIKGNGSNGPKADPLDNGNYAARVVQVIDLGIQKQRPFKGEPKAPAHCILLTYELGTEFLKDEEGNDRPDKPRWQTEDFPLHSLQADRAKSTKRANAIDPNGITHGNFAKMVGAPCTVTLVQDKKPDGKVWVNIGNVTPPMKGFNVPPLVNPPKVFDLDEPDLEVFLSLPEWLQDKIKSNLNYNGSKLQGLLGDKSEPAVDDAPADQPDDAEPADKDDIPW